MKSDADMQMWAWISKKAKGKSVEMQNLCKHFFCSVAFSCKFF